MQQTTACKVFKWTEMPTTKVLGGLMDRAGFRGDDALLTFNWISPDMPRWVPHKHPFDQIVLTVSGTQILEIDGEGMVCEPGTIVRVPGNAMHTGWPISKEPVLNIDVFAPPREDYLFLTKYQSEYPQPAIDDPEAAYHQIPDGERFAGKMIDDTSGLVYNWKDLPREEALAAGMQRSGFRGDDALVVFNWIEPTMPRFEPHSHPFDQIILIMEGAIMLELDGKTMECGPESIVHVPANVPHTAWPISGKPVVNMDVFAPPRADYLHITEYQKDFR
jgi:quercetin dioxygenase-like cupin family protein